MKKIIHNLRQKKHEDRRHILHMILFIFFILLVFLFVYSLNASFRKNKSELKNDFSELNEFKENIVEDLNNNNDN